MQHISGLFVSTKSHSKCVILQACFRGNKTCHGDREHTHQPSHQRVPSGNMEASFQWGTWRRGRGERAGNWSDQRDRGRDQSELMKINYQQSPNVCQRHQRGSQFISDRSTQEKGQRSERSFLMVGFFCRAMQFRDRAASPVWGRWGLIQGKNVFISASFKRIFSLPSHFPPKIQALFVEWLPATCKQPCGQHQAWNSALTFWQSKQIDSCWISVNRQTPEVQWLHEFISDKMSNLIQLNDKFTIRWLNLPRQVNKYCLKYCLKFWFNNKKHLNI